jgi:hypothetical protein
MTWFALARVLFTTVVALAAAVLQPLPGGAPANFAFGAILAGSAIVLERRLRHAEAAPFAGALVGLIVERHHRRQDCRRV